MNFQKKERPAQSKLSYQRRTRNGAIREPEKRQLYQLIARQLLHDGFVDAAELLVQSAQVPVTNPYRAGNRLSQLVTDGLLLNLVRARDIHEYAQQNRVERYIDESALYVPLATLHPGRLVMKERASTKSLAGHIRCVTTNPLGDLVACGGNGGVGVRIFSRQAMEEDLALASSTGVADDATTAISATQISEARIVTECSKAVESVCFHPCGEPLIAAGGRDGLLTVTNFSPTQPRLIIKHEDTYPIRHIAFHPSGSHLLMASDHYLPRLISLSDQTVLTPKLLDKASLTCCDFSPDGTLFALTSLDGTIRIMDSRTTKSAMECRDTHSSVAATSCVFSRTGRVLLTAGQDGIARLWDMRVTGPGEVASFGEVNRRLCTYRLRARFNSAESHIWCQTPDLDIKCYDIFSTDAICTIIGQRSFATCCFDATVITGDDAGRLRLWSPNGIPRH